MDNLEEGGEGMDGKESIGYIEGVVWMTEKSGTLVCVGGSTPGD